MPTRSPAFFGFLGLLSLSMNGMLPISPSIAQESMPQIPSDSSRDLKLVYPSPNHETTADRIFLIGTAPPAGRVTINGQSIHRSPAGHFAPSFPLTAGNNTFILRYELAGQPPQTLEIPILRVSSSPTLLTGLAFGENSLFPPAPIARQPGEWICWSAIAPPQATVTVTAQHPQGKTYPFNLTEADQRLTLPPNSAVLTKDNLPQTTPGSGYYQGCGQLSEPGSYQVRYHLTAQNQTLSETAPGAVEILDPQAITIATVTAEVGTTRTGPSTDYSRLTPLPTGTQARITAQEGDWLRLDYGAWIKASETSQAPSTVLPHSLLRSVLSRPQDQWTEVVFPLEVPVPVTIAQAIPQGTAQTTTPNNTLTLTLHNTIAQTDTIYIAPDSVIQGFTWEQTSPTQVSYHFHLQGQQSWGYKLRYEGTQLILSLKHPPQVRRGIEGLHIFLDPGHGSENDLGAQGPTGYPEKDVALKISQDLAALLRQRGAIVSLSREGDEDLWPQDRVALIQAQEPDLALSLHYNALPDAGDAENTRGVGAFWYHPQSANLAQFLHDYLTHHLDRPSYGIFWNNLALTRPSLTPAVLLELGFMINPEEFEWITDETAQHQLVSALADGLEAWFQKTRKIP